MVARRTVLGALSVSLAGCSWSHQDDFTPDDHVPDEWHETPERGNAAQITHSTSAISNYKRACNDTAVRTVSDHVEVRLDDDTNIAPVVCCEEIDGEASLIVYRRIDRDRDGDVVANPIATFENVRDATPKSVTGTIESDGQEKYVCSYPVYVSDTIEDID